MDLSFAELLQTEKKTQMERYVRILIIKHVMMSLCLLDRDNGIMKFAYSGKLRCSFQGNFEVEFPEFYLELVGAVSGFVILKLQNPKFKYAL